MLSSAASLPCTQREEIDTVQIIETTDEIHNGILYNENK